MEDKIKTMIKEQERLLCRNNELVEKSNGIFSRYKYPIITAEHTPLIWRYDYNSKTNPFMMERIGMNAVMNSGAIKLNGKYCLVVRVEGVDRKSFFAGRKSERNR